MRLKPRHVRLVLLVSAILPLLLKAQADSTGNITGKWRWVSDRGGQRVTLDLKASGTQLSGTIVMEQATLKAPVVDGKASYFLDPDTRTDDLRALFFPAVTFQIFEGQVSGNTISFTQISRSAVAGTRSQFLLGGNAPSAPGAQRTLEKLFYTGQWNGDRITLTRTYHTDPKEKDSWIVGTHAVTFVVERMR